MKKNIMQNRQSSTFFMNSYTSLSGFILPQNMHSLLFFSVIHRKSHPAIVFGGEMNTQNDYLKYSIQWRMKIIICSSCILFSSFWSASLPWSYVRFHTNSSPYKRFIKYIWSFFIVFIKALPKSMQWKSLDHLWNSTEDWFNTKLSTFFVISFVLFTFRH